MFDILFQISLKKTADIHHLEVADCSWLDDSMLVDEILPLLAEQDLDTFSATRSSLSNKAVAELTRRYSNLQQLRFTDCPNLNSEILTVIGVNCAKLTSLSFQYSVTVGWATGSTDVLSLLVKTCTADLERLEFEGFDCVSDIGVRYVSECYYSTLRKVNFNRCHQLTDSALNGLSEHCRLLREIACRSTQVADDGVCLMASRLSYLQTIDFAGCFALTDRAIRVVAERCARLEKLDVENCGKLSDEAFLAICKCCQNLRSLNYGGTALACVHPYVLGLKNLRHLRVNDCPLLTCPPGQIAGRGLNQIVHYYTDYNTSHRCLAYLVAARDVHGPIV